jgi:hypothetical protein
MSDGPPCPGRRVRSHRPASRPTEGRRINGRARSSGTLCRSSPQQLNRARYSKRPRDRIRE